MCDLEDVGEVWRRMHLGEGYLFQGREKAPWVEVHIHTRNMLNFLA